MGEKAFVGFVRVDYATLSENSVGEEQLLTIWRSLESRFPKVVNEAHIIGPNVAHEPPSERAKPACEGRARCACYVSSNGSLFTLY